MKVNTDSSIFGAVAGCNNPTYILDIGTGSGLLALMLAQRFGSAVIDAIEPEKDSADQAEANFRNSPWAERLRIHPVDIENFTQITATRYNLIVANPPWFTNSMRSSDHKKNLARHLETLTWEKLTSVVKKLLAENGIFYILLPASESAIFRMTCESEGFSLIRQVSIRIRGNEPANRVISGFSHSVIPRESQFITINDNLGGYSNQFRSLLKDFYLAF
jgi:tRNA1Val (adenine37-N6)-methyltransferase